MLDFLLDDLFNISCDLIVVPVSTVGSLSRPFENGLMERGMPRSTYRKSYKLGDVELVELKAEKFRYVAFACAVDDFTSNYAAIRQIGRNLSVLVRKHGDIQEIASPILGTGAGGLDYMFSRNIMLNAFYETGESNARLNFCTLDKDVYQSFDGRSLDVDTLSAALVLTAENKRFLSNEYIEPIAYSSDFYYEQARKHFFEYYNYSNEAAFFTRLQERFKNSKTTYSKLLRQLDKSTEEYHFMVLCGELVAHIDYNAYNKRLWNKNPDKRVLAKSNVNQTHWISNLIKIKESGDDLWGTNAENIRNALLYLREPQVHITMLSPKHRQLLFSNLLMSDYEGDSSLPRLFKFFEQAGYRSINPDNEGALLSRVLYLPDVKKMWLTEEIEEEEDLLFANDTVDTSNAIMLIEECLKSQHKSLDLGCCGLTDLSSLPELFECTNLEELILSNEWAIYEGGKWRKQRSKNDGKRNLLTLLPTELNKLKQLKRLICGGDWKKDDDSWDRWAIRNIKPLQNLHQLEYVNLSNNQIEDPTPLTGLVKLKFIHLNNNLISEPLQLFKLSKLEELNLSSNKLVNLISFSGAPKLVTLDLHANQIGDLSPLKKLIRRMGIKNAKWELNTINIAQNPLEFPPMEIVNLGKEAVLSNFEDVRSRGEYINVDVKIVLIGNSEVGKSTLVKYLD